MLIQKYPNILDELTSDTHCKMFSDAPDDYSTFFECLEKFSTKLYDARSTDGESILHLVCETNNAEIIDATLKALEEKEFKGLLNDYNNEGKNAFMLLNENNKLIFERAFNFSKIKTL